MHAAVVFVSGTRERSERYELHLEDGEIKQLTKLDEYVNTPEISPDDRHILFTNRAGQGNTRVWIMNRDGNHPRLVNDTIDTRGHSSWSVRDFITLDMGGSFKHEIYVMNVDGENLGQISEAGNNSQGESFSPGGNRIVFSASTDVANKYTGSCELYSMHPDGSDIRGLTENHYCNYQPRWGK